MRFFYLRNFIYIGIALFLIYILIFRRRSPRKFLTEFDVQQFLRHKNLNHTYPRSIPRIIHQTWKTKDVPIHWNQTVQSIRVLNAEQFEYRLWTDEDMHEYVRQVEPDFYQNTFLTYSLNIQRIDAFRYVILYYIGGHYIDMDNGGRQSFESLFEIIELLDSQSKHLAAFPRTSPIDISNGFMISTKGHPLFRLLISSLRLFNHNYLISYLTVMISTGPSYLSIIEFYFDQISSQSSVRILDETVYSSIYTWHTTGNSWHRRDARIILYIYHFLRRFLIETNYPIFIVFSLIFFILFVFRRRFRRCQRRF